MSEAVVIDLANDTIAYAIEERILGYVAHLDVLTTQARMLLPAALGDDIADELGELRAYIEGDLAPELDELRDRAAWFEIQPKPEPVMLPDPGPSSIIVRTPNPSPPPDNVLTQ